MTHDLAIEGGLVFAPDGPVHASVYVDGERIAAVTSERLSAIDRVDAAGLLVMPGMVDAHVHLMDPASPEREDFPSGTAAAAIAGVTTIIEHTHGGPVRSVDDLGRKVAYLANRSLVDHALAAHAWPGEVDLVRPLWHAGIAFFKAFTCTTHGVPGFDPAALLRLFQAAAIVEATCLVHAEESSLLDAAERDLRAAGRADGGMIPAWRNRDAEAVGLAVTRLLAERSGARVVAAHVSSTEALHVARGRAGERALTIETCPQYLTLHEDEVRSGGGLRKFTPPARARSDDDLQSMWSALADGSIDYVATDHAPSTRAQKTAGSIWDVHFGLPGLDTTLPVLLDGASRGLIDYERVVEAYATSPARVYRLGPRKGRLAEGSDADIVLVDPARRWTVDAATIRSKAGWSPFEGRELVGGAVATYLRGRLIARDGQLHADPGAGRFVSGPGAA